MNRITKYLNSKKYAAKLNLRAKIEREILPALMVSRNADARLSSSLTDNENQEFVFALGKYQEHAFAEGHTRGSEDLATENEPMAAALVAGIDQAAVTALHA
jgi:hypothetical protein